MFGREYKFTEVEKNWQAPEADKGQHGLKNVMRKSFFLLALLPGVRTEGGVNNPVGRNTREAAQNQKVFPEQSRYPKEIRTQSLEEIQEGMWTDEGEKIFLKIKGEKELYRPVVEVGKNGTSLVRFEKYDAILGEKKEKDFTFTHTHYASVLIEVGWRVEDIERFKNEPAMRPYLPPSMYDYEGLMAMKINYETKKNKVVGEVLDLNGSWKIEIDSQGKYYEMLVQVIKVSGGGLLNKLEDMTPEEVDVLQSLDYEKLNPDELLKILQTNPKLARLYNTLEDLFRETDEKYRNVAEVIHEMENVAWQMRQFDFRLNSLKELKELYKQYKHLANTIGIRVVHTALNK